MKNRKMNIWIEAEQWEEGWNVDDDNTDVIVTFSDRTKWIASFFTYKNILTLHEQNKQTGECLNGGYFWSSDMVLIDFLSRERIVEVINHLIDNDEFNYIFTRSPDVEPEDDHLYPSGFFA